MKGMMNLLERAGIVRRVDDDQVELPAGPAAEEAAAPVEPTPSTDEPAGAAPPAEASGLTLEQIYAEAAVPACVYPAERLLRLIDGLKAMDEGMRRTTIQAIDAADDSWTIADPLRDAAAKVAAIERHAASVRAEVAQAEQQAQQQLAELQQRQEATVAEIRRQISDLEGLLAREIARGTQAAAALDSGLQSQREGARQQLESIGRAASALTGLIAQFGGNVAAR